MRISLHEPCLYATFSGALMHCIHTNQPTNLQYNIPVVPPAGTSAAPKDRDRDSSWAES